MPPVGKVVRRLLPRSLERRAANAYRSYYIDLAELARTISSLGPFAHIIEVGCGEGALARQLANASEARITGIDVAANPGVNYAGTPNRATFRQVAAEVLVAEGASADAVVVSDVVHHVAAPDRFAFLRSCHDLVRPGGVLVVKEWERRRNVAHALAYGSDRYLTGDANVAFLNRDELLKLLGGSCPELELACECRIPPRRNNLLLAFRRPR